jgi:hypothetical protein
VALTAAVRSPAAFWVRRAATVCTLICVYSPLHLKREPAAKCSERRTAKTQRRGCLRVFVVHSVPSDECRPSLRYLLTFVASEITWLLAGTASRAPMIVAIASKLTFPAVASSAENV